MRERLPDDVLCKANRFHCQQKLAESQSPRTHRMTALFAACDITQTVGMACTVSKWRRRGTDLYYIWHLINPLTPNDVYIRRTAQLISRRCILNICSTNILTEYFEHAAHSPFLSSRCSLFYNAVFFGSCNIHILNTECAKI